MYLSCINQFAILAPFRNLYIYITDYFPKAPIKSYKETKESGGGEVA